MDLAGGGDDEGAVVVGDGGGAAVGVPDVGADGLGDEVDDLLAALVTGGAGLLLRLLLGVVGVLEGALAAAGLAGALGGGLEVELRAVEVGDVHDEVVDGVDAGVHVLVGDLPGGDFDDAVVKPSTQRLLKSFDLKVEYFETLVATGVVGGHDIAPASVGGT